MGVWTTDANPNGGSVTVFIRVSESSQPVAHARVYLEVASFSGGYRLGPLTTDGAGLASARITFGVGGGSPVFLTATTTIASQTYTGTYTFVTGLGVK